MDVGPAIAPEDLRAFEARFSKRSAAEPAAIEHQPAAKRSKPVADPMVHAAAQRRESERRRLLVDAVRAVGSAREARYVEAAIDMIFATGTLVGAFRGCTQRVLNNRFVALTRVLPRESPAEFIVDRLLKDFRDIEMPRDQLVSMLQRHYDYVQPEAERPLDPAKRHVRPAIELVTPSPQIPQKAPAS